MSLQSLIKVQEDILSRLSRTKLNFKKSPKERINKQYVGTRLENVEVLWAQFSRTHTQIVSDFDTKELKASPYSVNEVYFSAEELYLDLKCDLKLASDKLNTVEGSDMSTNVSESKYTNIKLPRITIPPFSGKYTEWPTFRDLFISAIHKNTTLDKVQKLHYLKSYLTGEAEQLLRHTPISETNYDRCWSQLESRYNNKKYLSHCILRRLLSQKNITIESASALKELLDTTTDCLGALSNLGINVTSWDILIIHILTLKLDADSRKEWELKVTSNTESDQLPTYEQFKEFLTNRYRAFEFLENKPNKNTNTVVGKTRTFHIAALSCQFCNDEDHKISNCRQFVANTVDTRRKYVQDNNLCFNCLGYNHSARVCRSTASCRICRRRHHSLLHPQDDLDATTCKGEGNATSDTGPAKNEYSHSIEVEDVTEVVACLSKGSVHNQILLATALVKAISVNGSKYTLRALLDQGSQASFVTEDIVQSLGLKKRAAKGIISGIGGGNKLTSNSVVEVKIQSKIDPSFELVVKAYVLKSITSLLPVRKTAYLDWVEVNDLQLADPRYHTPDKVDMLLGAEIYTKILQSGLKRAPCGSTMAQCTKLGWILSGTVDSEGSSNIAVLHVHIGEEEILRKFWELEKEPNELNKKILTEEETKCEEIFNKTTKRNESGRYVVNLPFKNENPQCQYGDSKKIAIKRLHALESKLNKNKDFKAKYNEVLREYIELGHMQAITEADKLNKHAVYLPHHAVVRNDKETSKVRVVFDASCRGTNGISLNDDLMVGPNLQSDLRHLLIRWRVHPICLTADIVKMYRQIRIAEHHTDFQRIVWRDSDESEIKEYKLLTVTFGTASAPYLAVRSMQQAARDENDYYPLAAEKVLKDYYMDDLMTGCQEIEEGINIYTQMNSLLLKAGFELQKWSSNSDELLEKIIVNRGNETEEGIKIKQDEIIKILGLTWNRNSDTFQYSVQLPLLQEPVTKRKILSDISRLFDPLGWVSPVIVLAKTLIQKLWLTGIGWDCEVPSELKNEWITYRQELQNITELSIPRWLFTKQSDKQINLHGFCDASKSAYAAVIYARVVDSKGKVHVTLLTAKTNVAPIKTVSIPRLELCGAVLLAKLLAEVSEVMGIDKSNLYAWTDSEIVLAWINSHPSRWKTFVANRVSEILCKSEPKQWNHIQSGHNPADCASRGLYPSELLKSKLWFDGPNFLRNETISLYKPNIRETSIEEVKVHVVEENYDTSIWDKYSSLNRLVRIIAYCRRFLQFKKPKVERKKSFYLTAEELRLALEICIRKCQKKAFSDEVIKGLIKRNKGQTIPRSLNAYLDCANILRVGGRLELSDLSENRRHPILIPRRSHFTDLLIADAHYRTLHGGLQLMLNYLGTKYFILGVKGLVKSYVRKCVICLRYNASKNHQLMGQLPSSRVTPSRPFKNAGVDYAGPINLRTTKGRGHHSYKGYICLFVCMVTKAVHIEIVSDLTTEGFLAAFRRFVARRGHCKDIWSDNGSNFQGASKELRLLLQSQNSGFSCKEIAESLASEGTTWHYIPPHAPNFGGLWEAGIKSCKQHLRKVIGSSTLTYEEMATLLSQIEACLNSRPLYRLTDPNTVDALTPGHFLIGEPLINAPDHNFEENDISTLKRWHLVQKMMQVFWRRWSNEYLNTLLHRYKWSIQSPEPSIGDIVLIKEDNLPPCKWLLGRVIEKHPGQDNLTRVVTIRTNTTTIKRPTSKLCVLPIA